MLAEEASAGLLLPEDRGSFLEKVFDEVVVVDFVDRVFAELDLFFERFEFCFGPELDVVVHAGPDLARRFDEADPVAFGGLGEGLDDLFLEGGRDRVEQERQAVLVRGLQLSMT